MQAADQKVPALEQRPSLTVWTAGYYSAFQTLVDSRSLGMTVGMIPLSEIAAYCSLYGIDDIEERDRFIGMIKAMDMAYTKHLREKKGHHKGARPDLGGPNMPVRPAGRLRRR